MGRKKILVYSVAIIALIIFIKSLFHIQLNLSEDQFTDINQCPACYGSNLCPHFYHSDISLIGISKLKYLNFINSKNVFGGKFLGERIILKKLAHDWEIIEKDKLICKKAELIESCEVKKATQLLISKSFLNKSKNSLVDLVKVFGSKTDISQCPSQRLLTYIFNKMYSQQIAFHSVEQTQIIKLSELMYSLLVNPEALILQTFSQSEGWPFPRYYGACGRVVVEEYVGRTIAYYENAPWKQRLDIAYQLLLIAQMLTENFSHFAFYLTDVNMDNFAVKPDGTVLLIDVESIVIVDRLNKGKEKQPVKNLHHSKGEFCKDCLNFSYEDLCNSDLSDHNYYAICKGLLIPHSYYSEKGLLFNIPERIDSLTNLSGLIEECANPSKILNRFFVVPKILQAMKSLM